MSSSIEEFKQEDDDATAEKFEKYYESGFRSHRAIVSPENESLQAKFSAEYKLKRRTEGLSVDDSEESELIADPYLASFVNDNNEIIVNDTLYRFTEEGLFFSHVKDSVDLFDYLNDAKKSGSFGNKVDPCIMVRMETGVSSVDKGVYKFIAPAPYECGTGGGSGGYSPIPSYPQTSAEEKLQERINSLIRCNDHSNWIFEPFGKRKFCLNYFDDKHRIKTEFWDQDYKFYKSVGVLAKTQRRRFGVWWASESDELHLGINRILLKYKFPEPKIKIKQPSSLFSTDFKAPLYLYGGRFKARESQINQGLYFVDVQIDVTENVLPFFKIETSNILNIYIPNLPVIDGYKLKLTTEDITSKSNIKELYKMGTDFISSQINSGNPNQPFAVTYQKSDKEIETIYFDERYSVTNENKIKRIFYEDASFQLFAGWGSAKGWKYTVKPAENSFIDYTHYEVDVYGLARRGNAWKGSRLIF
ncbi:hypothetical protein FKX85_18780 [Echinicola soli]|uniref:Uncharacterized protein n=1 Tax=Echinicola soli TaxID=2591634 RepID=A0A514CMF7_9BACT|nr:hypothetical protein [Echinicola soli]QDH80978.1 hypothetical protein FKX85_18780 [Echinicola soli]